MKLFSIIALFILSVKVVSAFWTAAVQPVILSIGAVFAALNQDVLDVQTIEWRSFLPFINKLAGTLEEEEEAEANRLYEGKEIPEIPEEELKKIRKQSAEAVEREVKFRESGGRDERIFGKLDQFSGHEEDIAEDYMPKASTMIKKDLQAHSFNDTISQNDIKDYLDDF